MNGAFAPQADAGKTRRAHREERNNMARQISTARKVGRVIKSIVKIAVALLLVVVMVAANTMLPGYSRMVDSLLSGFDQSWDNSSAQTEGLDLQYNKADYTAETIADAEKALDQQLAAEGVVMVQNDDASLPLASGTTLSFFSINSRSLGSSQSMLSMVTGDSSTSDGLSTALAAHGLGVNTTLQDFYANGAGKDYVQGAGSVSFGDNEDFSLNECPLSVMQDADVLDSCAGTTPVFVMKRVAGEGRDAPRSMYNHATKDEDKTKNYLEPDSTELEILRYINDNFDNGIVIVNSAVVVELDWLEQFPNIRSVLLVPSTGTNGMDSLAGILAGDINPSGRTVDTFAVDALSSPAAQNFGDYQYVDEDGNLTKYNYVSYNEGIYVGYKYYETRYEDAVLGQGNAGDYAYDQQVVYPFGYGLSYTTFEWSGFSTAWSGKDCTATVTVTNTGNVAGKDVVELYAQSPYTDYDRANGVEKAAVQLVGYAKTKQLEPGESQTVTVTFNESELKAYDANGAGTYILDAGTYYVTAGRDAHDAANNVLAAKGAAVTSANAAMCATYVPANTTVDTTTYATDDYSGEKITNQLSDAAPDGTQLTRADWEGTFPTHDGTPLEGTVSTWGNEINGTIDGQPASLLYTKTASADLLAKLDSTDSGNPTDDSTLTDEPVYGAKNGLTLIELRGLDYDDPKWSDLLDQLTPEDYDLSIARGGYGTEHLDSVGKPFNVDADTAAGLIYGGTGYTFAGPLMLAQTYNQDLALEYGNLIGNEALLGGATNWYAPSMNIHRTPFSGRNGEYYSEDSFLSGKTASLQIYGAAQKGFFATIKHFAFNDQENHRGDREGQYSIATWVGEQAAREIYLKPFEMCMKVGDVELSYVKGGDDGNYQNATTTIRACQGVMTGFNRIGATWTGGSYELLTGIVRNEWGFDGWIITDNANTGVFMDAAQMIRAGGDTKLTYLDQASSMGMWSFDKTNKADYHYAREALHHLLYLTANGNAMNGAMPGSVLKYGMTLTGKVQTGANVIGVVGLGLIGFTAWRNHVKRKAERAE